MRELKNRDFAAVVLVILVASAAIVGLLYHFRSPSPNPPNTLPVNGGAFATNSPSGYNIQVTRVALDQLYGINAYILNVNAWYSGQGTWRLVPADFELVSSTSTVFTQTSVQGITNPMSGVVLVEGQHAIGQLAFGVPVGQTPLELEYLNQSAGISAKTEDIPQVSAYVCAAPHVEASVAPASAPGSMVYAQNLGQNPSYAYVTGDSIVVTLYASFYPPFGNNPGQAYPEVTSITSNVTGVVVSQVQPALPIAVSKGPLGYLVTMTVALATPPERCVTDLNLQVTMAFPP